MDNEQFKVDNYVRALDGISYFQWKHLQSIVETHFEKENHEFKRQLTLTAEEVNTEVF